ncbi:MAG: VOC family protein [Myxococcota bacterium]|nr:VOC family protein [Myxococcales bacterium]
MTSKLGQYCINVSDLEASARFYQEALGLELLVRTDVSPTVQEVIVGAKGEGAQLQLAQHLDREGPIEHGNAFWKLYVETDDCAGLYARALAAGATAEMEPRALDKWPVTIAFVKDPDGYLIELVEHTR